ncbi:pre-mRNA processing factor 3-domain-containing protein [Thamnidium elegans]|nr:pre-mRNA processing factor 3-domain-containing protein [Thamnidium elegans]
MSDSNQQALIDAKKAEVLAKLARFQQSNARPPVPRGPTQQRPSHPQPTFKNKTLVTSQQRAPVRPSKPVAPIPAPPTKGQSGGLNLVEIQRRIAEAKSRLSSNPAAVAALRPSGRVNESKPPALPVDESGNIDFKAMMDTGLIPRRETTNSKALQRKKQNTVAAAAEKKPLKLEENVPAEFTDPTKNPYFDPTMGVKIAPVSRRSRPLKFVQPGKYINIANEERAKQQLEKLKQEITESVRKAGMQTEFDVSDKVIKRVEPPAVEWWDAPFLANKTYQDLNDTNEINPDKLDALVTMYVHHPVIIRPPSEINATPIVRSLMMTKKERKKMRRQRRAEALKDKRDKIRLGLLEPDAPKVKISNLMKVLGEEAIQDPTKVEAKVRKEMELRQKMHDKANEQRKLTPEERRAKIMNKLKEDQKASNEVAVFKVKSCTHPKHRYKIETNAKQFGLTGIVIAHPKCNIIIVEGGPKSIKAYKRLMLRRIDWNDMPTPKNLEQDDTAMEVDDPIPYGLPEGEENKCFLVWTGTVKNKSFRKFTWRAFSSEKMAREELGKWNVENYWDAALLATDEELAARQPVL